MDKKAYRSFRFNWYRQVDIHKRTVKETCQIFNISRKTYYKWRKRDYGLGPLRPNYNLQPNTKITPDIERIITDTKLKTNYGPLKMKMYLKKHYDLDLSTTIIYRFYKKRRLIKRPQRKLPWYQPLKKALVIVKQGQGVQFDTKYIWDKGVRKFLLSALDPYTLKYFCKVYDNRKSHNVILFQKNAEKFFGFKILSVQTDNGSEFRGNYHLWLDRKGIPHYFIPKGSPCWNAHVERMHKTIDDEYFLNQGAFKTITEWLNYYNFERIHLSLNGLTPQEKYLESVTLDC